MHGRANIYEIAGVLYSHYFLLMLVLGLLENNDSPFS
jgi:hypothetical protein